MKKIPQTSIEAAVAFKTDVLQGRLPQAAQGLAVQARSIRQSERASQGRAQQAPGPQRGTAQEAHNRRGLPPHQGDRRQAADHDFNGASDLAFAGDEGCRGDHRAQQKFTELLSETERANKAQKDELLNEAIKYKTYWEQEIERCKRLGITPPEPLPHPDDIVIDMRTGQVIFKGPMTKEDKAEWDWLRNRLEAYDRQIAQETLMLKDPKMKPYHSSIQDEIARCMRMRDKIASVIGEPKKDD